MLGTVLLSQHRFRDAIETAERAQPHRARATRWNLGVIGDAHLELGEYDAAFDAFDRDDAAAPLGRRLRAAPPTRASCRAISRARCG